MQRSILFSGDSKKAVDVVETEQGLEIQLSGQADSTSVYFQGRLNKMLSYSEGKPWSLQSVLLDNASIFAEEQSIRICGKTETLDISMELAFDEQQLLRLNVTWANRTERLLSDVAVGILLELPEREKEIVTIPHMIYNNNPSSDPDRIVPRLGVGAGKGFVCEEHRLPIPCVNMEWAECGVPHYISVFSIPTCVESEDGIVQYGSLGAIKHNNRTTAAAMSGVLMFNGEQDVVYVGKSKTSPYNGGYLDFPPGFSLSKQYVFDWGTLPQTGWGFREVVQKALQLFDPQGAKPLSVEEIISLKTNALDDRWRFVDGAAGYVKFNDTNDFGNVSRHPLHFLYGWTGQCLKLAWCDAKLGFDDGQPDRIERCEQAVDFYLRDSLTSVPGVRNSSYHLDDRRWDNFYIQKEAVISSRAYGETIADLAEIVLLFQSQQRQVPVHWLAALRESADFFLNGTLSSGIYPAAWQLDGQPADELITSAGIPCLIAVLKAYRILGNYHYLEHAEQIMQRYYELHARTFERPFARSTLDAKCEDKEAGMYFFLAAFELYVVTKRQEYKEWAEVSADWLLTFVYMWNPAFDKGAKLREANFQATGWPGVSVQNHHLDVFFPTFHFWQFGRLTGNSGYETMGRMIFDAMGQGICTKPGEWGFTVVGEQGEGFYQTHYHSRGNSNNWNPSWVIALALYNALKFREANGT